MNRLNCICGAPSEVYFRVRIVPKDPDRRYGTGPTKTGTSRVLCQRCADGIYTILTERLAMLTTAENRDDNRPRWLPIRDTPQ